MSLINKSIEAQFWTGLKQVDVPEFDLDIKIVDEFPEKIYKHAKEMDFWSFVKEKPGRFLLVGFSGNGGHSKIPIFEAYAKLNGYEAIQEILIHAGDSESVYKIIPKHAASQRQFQLRILYEYYPYKMYDGQAIQHKVDEQMEAKDVKEKENQNNG